MVTFEVRHANYPREDRNDRDQSGPSLPRLRGEQGSHAQGALQRGAQGRGAAGLPGAHLASWAEPGLRNLTQDDHCMAEKNS